MNISPATRDYQTIIAVASLVIGPLLMAVGSLVHPEERADTEKQIAIVVEHATRWYASHAFLFAGIALFVPGFLALTALTAERNPVAGRIARLLLLIGVGGLCAVFAAEMLLGRFIEEGADAASATILLETMFSGPMAAVMLPAAFSFFLGNAVFATPLILAGGRLCWPAAGFALGGLFIVAEIALAQYVLAMVGTVLIAGASMTVAWFLWEGNASDRSAATSPHLAESEDPAAG